MKKIICLVQVVLMAFMFEASAFTFSPMLDKGQQSTVSTKEVVRNEEMETVNLNQVSTGRVDGIFASEIGAGKSMDEDNGENIFINDINREYVLDNSYMSRIITVKDGVLYTSQIINKRAGINLVPTSCQEFVLRISEGTDKEGTDKILTAKDFVVTSVSREFTSTMQTYCFQLRNEAYALGVKVFYKLAENDFYGHKHLEITSDKKVTLEKIDVESIAFEDAFQNYKLKQITTRQSGRWKPGLGQPVYTKATATFWGMEFPGAFNTVEEGGTITCGYLRGKELLPQEPYTTYRSVVGVADDKDFIDDTFFYYIDRIRRRPARLQVQYNSWFDYGNRVSKETFAKSLRKIHEELVINRGCRPLNAYVIDDGWQDNSKNVTWADTVWKINKKFAPYFKDSRKEVLNAGSTLGIWLSPASIFGSRSMVKRMGEYGFENLSYGMSMTGEKYMGKLEERVLDLARHGVSYFKFDGLFGHLNIRDFELQGRGTAAMPQLGLEGFSTNDERLSDSKYDELKGYYLVAGTERLMKIFDSLHKVNPNIFIAITNGAYLSPWWLSYIDVVWLINAGDAVKGKDRTGELVYRDYVYHQIWQQENTKFPMNSIFNHEPKKITANEDRKSFKDYLFMNLSRGTGFVELYLKTDSLSATDWDVLAEGLKWTYQAFPTFKRVRMHGGNPKKNEVYGYTAWNDKQGYISIHNPSAEQREYKITLDRKTGLMPDSKKVYRVTSVLENKSEGVQKQYHYGDVLSLTLRPKEILLLDFTVR